mmetsp:Transcript_6071/g.9306  ORF Transcript_6071/g.9306 Transcript_6071/m.9306 type:complete len:546 (-) Transcript_6071:395-2032(-)
MPSNSDQAERFLWDNEGPISTRNLLEEQLDLNRTHSRIGISSLAGEEGSQVTNCCAEEGVGRAQADKFRFKVPWNRRRKKTPHQSTVSRSPQEIRDKQRDTSRDDVDGTHLLLKEKAENFKPEDLGTADDETVDNSVLQAFQNAQIERRVSDLTMQSNERYLRRGDFDVGDPIINHYKQKTKVALLEEIDNDDEGLGVVDAEPLDTSEHAEIVFQPKSQNSHGVPPPPPAESSSPAVGFYNTKPILPYGIITENDEHIINNHKQKNARTHHISQLLNINTDQEADLRPLMTSRENYADPNDEVSTLTPASMIESNKISQIHKSENATSSSGVRNVPQPIIETTPVIKDISDQDTAFEELSPLSLLNLSHNSCNVHYSGDSSQLVASFTKRVPDSVAKKNHQEQVLPPPKSEFWEGDGMSKVVTKRTSQSYVEKKVHKPPVINSEKRSVTFNIMPYDLDLASKDDIDSDGRAKGRMMQESCTISSPTSSIKGEPNVFKTTSSNEKQGNQFSVAAIVTQNLTNNSCNDDEDNSPSPYELYRRAVGLP